MQTDYQPRVFGCGSFILIMNGDQATRGVLECCTLHGVVETGKELEKGPHADLVELKYMGLRCAGKKFHRSAEDGKNKDLLRRCTEGCEVLSKLRHPNIVQFIGVYFQQGFDVPVIVTELLPFSLANCLERYGLLPEGMSYQILQDVALGLEYLHGQSPPVVHRSVCASSVLLTRDMSAKLADVGVANIVEQDEAPPKAFAQNAKHDRKTDVFAYGVLMIHVLSGRLLVPDSVRVNGSLSAHSETNCKQQYLSRIKDDHPLKDMIFQSLSNSPVHRPTITEINRRIRIIASQFPTTFANSLEMLHKINTDATVQRELRMQVQNLSAQDSPDSLPVTEMEKLRQKLVKLSAQNVALRASLSRKRPTAAVQRRRVLDVSSEKPREVYSPVQVNYLAIHPAPSTPV